MSFFGEYEFEYVDPDQAEPEPAPIHPDPAIAARLYSQSSVVHTRRFCLIAAERDPESVKWHGLQFTSGRAVIWSPGGDLHGSYRSVDSARRRLARDRYDPYLVWLEPKPSHSGPVGTARTEAFYERRNNEPQQWFMTIGFTAYGPQTARLLTMDVVKSLADMIPGYDRKEVAIGHDGAERFVGEVFCDRNPNCAKTPGHAPPCLDEDYTPLDDEPRQDGGAA